MTWNWLFIRSRSCPKYSNVNFSEGFSSADWVASSAAKTSISCQVGKRDTARYISPKNGR